MLTKLMRQAVVLVFAVILVTFGFVMGTAVIPGEAESDLAQRTAFSGNQVANTASAHPQAINGTVLTEIEQIFSEAYTRVGPSVVSIVTYANHPASEGQRELVPIGSGSGFVIDYDGNIVTNFHVVDEASRIDVYFIDGTIVPAEVVGGDLDSDLAVIKVDLPPERLSPVTLADSDALTVGQTVLAIGNPFSQDWTLTSGIISALGRTIEGLNNYSIGAVIQTDAAINPGNSGGPLLNLAGEVIGVNSQIVSRSDSNSGVGFAIPSNLVARVVPELKEHGAVDYSYLGIYSAPMNLDLMNYYDLPNNTQGVVIDQVQNGTPAAAAGLHTSTESSVDVITAIDGTLVTGFNSLISYLSIHTRPGDTVNLTVLRGGVEMIIPLTLGSRP